MKLNGNRCQCTACGEYFSSERSFDRHRIGDYGVNRRCIPTADLLANGWLRNPRGFLAERHAGRAPADISARRAPSAGVRPHSAPPAPETRLRIGASP